MYSFQTEILSRKWLNANVRRWLTTANKSHLREMSLLVFTSVRNKEFCICVVSDGRVSFQSNYDDVFILSTAEIYPKVYHTCFFIVTYFAPLCLMVLAYIQICHKLWFQQVCIRVRHQLLQAHFKSMI